eukprot:4797745-Prymnesium_polylepis.1
MLPACGTRHAEAGGPVPLRAGACRWTMSIGAGTWVAGPDGDRCVPVRSRTSRSYTTYSCTAVPYHHG